MAEPTYGGVPASLAQYDDPNAPNYVIPRRAPDFSTENSKGNLARITSGSQSPRLVSQRAKEVHEELTAYAPQLEDPASMLLTEDLCRVEAIAELLYESIMHDSARLKKGIGGVPTTRLQRFIEATGRKGRILDAMGISPQAKARMHKEASDAEINKREIAKQLRNTMAEGAKLTQRAIEEGRHKPDGEEGSES